MYLECYKFCTLPLCWVKWVRRAKVKFHLLCVGSLQHANLLQCCSSAQGLGRDKISSISDRSDRVHVRVRVGFRGQLQLPLQLQGVVQSELCVDYIGGILVLLQL